MKAATTFSAARVCCVCAVVILAIVATGCSAPQGPPPVPAVIVPPALVPQSPRDGYVPGVDNFGFISADVWRGARPTPAGLRTLAAMGVKTVIDLREENESADVPKGVLYVRMPVSALHANLVDTVAVLAAIEASPKPVFIHCQQGRDRTGLAIAAYRLSQGMSRDDALREMYNFRINFWWREPITTQFQLLKIVAKKALTTRPATVPSR